MGPLFSLLPSSCQFRNQYLLNNSRQAVTIVLCSTCYAAGPATSSGTRTTWTRLLCHFGTPHALALRRTFALPHAKSNYSRTSTNCARKSNHSRTLVPSEAEGYAKTGGWGALSCASFTSFASITSVPLATCHSPLTPIIPAPLATAALRVVPASIFTTTSRIHVGAPTILFRERTTASQQFPDHRAMLSSNCALLTVDCELLFSPKSNHSRTYARFTRKSNHSRTYAKQGGGGR